MDHVALIVVAVFSLAAIMLILWSATENRQSESIDMGACYEPSPKKCLRGGKIRESRKIKAITHSIVTYCDRCNRPTENPNRSLCVGVYGHHIKPANVCLECLEVLARDLQEFLHSGWSKYK